jgi:hypothetical protein
MKSDKGHVGTEGKERHPNSSQVVLAYIQTALMQMLLTVGHLLNKLHKNYFKDSTEEMVSTVFMEKSIQSTNSCHMKYKTYDCRIWDTKKLNRSFICYP